MYRAFSYLTGISIILFTSCNSPSNTNGTNTSGGDTSGREANNPPVETRTPNTDYKPAFAGQTRAPGVTTNTAYKGTIITSSLNHPWGIALLPDGRFLVTEKGGTMRIVTTAGAVGQPIAGVPAVNDRGQGGLLGITLDPDFKDNRMLYWTFSENTGEGNLTSVAKARLSADEKSLENVTVIYRATPAYRGNLHYGSRILVDKSGNLIFSTGERSDKVTRPQSQDLNSALGKIIRITKDGKPAEGNPFIGR